VNIVEIPILGQTGMGHRPAGGKGTWTGTAHYNQSQMRKMADVYQKTGYMPYFQIQVINEDPTSSVGSQTVILSGCLCETFTLAKFLAGEADELTEELSGTFESFDIPKQFTKLSGM
jgi:hypothetical protein